MANVIKVYKKNGDIENVLIYPGLTVNFIGDNNHISIFEGTTFFQSRMTLANNTTINIKQSQYEIHKLQIWGASESKITIGENFSCWGVELRCHEPKSEITIGDDCMFSEEIVVYPTDVHTIYDIYSGDVLNLARSIYIGDRVWCGRRVSILKGVILRNDVVIGMNSVVTKKINESNIVIGGYPAEVIKRGIGWVRTNPSDFNKKQLNK